MKWLVGLAVSVWLICGLIGAWWLGSMHIETIAKGPMSLAKAYNDNPMSYPGPELGLVQGHGLRRCSSGSPDRRCGRGSCG